MADFSLLLGAGFSVNKGYPTAVKLNEKLLNLDPEDFWVHTDGTVHFKERDTEDPCWYTDDSKHRHFLVRLIHYYNSRMEKFNYEDFYDFYYELSLGKIDEDFDNFCETFRQEFNITTNDTNLLSTSNRFFNQLIALYLVDGDGRKFYESIHYSKPYYDGYTGFLNCMETWGHEGIVHIHTLNHDVFFESLASSDWIQGQFSDGFQENGSVYYGGLSGDYKVRLSYFSNNYKNKFRLYKLHGSVDQFPFHLQDVGIDTYVKTKLGIGTTELYKEVQNDAGEYHYLNDWLNYHSDFLSGTTSKILRYREPSYYEKVFTHFEQNLVKSTKLVIIGYGCGDTEINNIIDKYYKHSDCPIFIVDPFPSEIVISLVEKYGAKLIVKTPNELTPNDFEI